MHPLSAAAILEKNKLSSTGAWLILLDVVLPGVIDFYLVLNTENIFWRGREYIAFPFDISESTEDGREIPAVTLKISNVSQAIQPYLEQSGGGVGAEVTVRIVHSDHLDNLNAEIEETFICQSCHVDANWISFSLGPGDPATIRRPERRYLKNFCPYPYKGLECGVNVAALTPDKKASCNKTLQACRERNNAVRFGGEPSIPQGGIYVNVK